MIGSFGDDATEDVFHGIKNKKTLKYVGIIPIVERKLDMINAAEDLRDLLMPPSNHLEKLRGALKDYYSVRINDQHRIIFVWGNGNAYKVKIIDYH
jgi:toxin HigB-1